MKRIACLLFGATVLATNADAQSLGMADVIPAIAPGDVCEYYPSPYTGQHYLRVPEEVVAPGKQAAATFDVTYNGFTQEAEDAFQRAVNTWASLITSGATINVTANWDSLEGNILGSAGPTNFFTLSGGGLPAGERRLAGIALVEAMFGNQNGGSADVSATFNSNFDDWHFGTEPPPIDEIDFQSVVLHELGHGLNFLQLASVDDGDSSNGVECIGTVDQGCMDIVGNPAFADYGLTEALFEDGDEVMLKDTSNYADPSVALGTAMEGGEGGVFFAGATATAKNGGAPPRMFSPSTFNGGSSLSHFDEATFNGTHNALMTPSISFGEMARAPGSVGCALLADIGWTIDQLACDDLPLPMELSSFEALAVGGSVLLQWETGSESSNAGFEVQALSEGADGHASAGWQTLAFVDGHGTTSVPHSYSYQTGELEPGTRQFRLRQIDFDGSTVFSPLVEVSLAPVAAYHLTAPYPNPAGESASLSLAVQQPQDVTVAVFDVTGRRVQTLYDGPLDANRTRGLVVDAGSLPAGMYVVHVTGETFRASMPLILIPR